MNGRIVDPAQDFRDCVVADRIAQLEAALAEKDARIGELEAELAAREVEWVSMKVLCSLVSRFADRGRFLHATDCDPGLTLVCTCGVRGILQALLAYRATQPGTTTPPALASLRSAEKEEDDARPA
jgi:hypothetical protein